MLRKKVKLLLEQLQVCIFAKIVFGVRCTLRITITLVTFKTNESFVVFLGKTRHTHNVTLFEFTGFTAGFCGMKRLSYPVEGQDSHSERSDTVGRPKLQDTKSK